MPKSPEELAHLEWLGYVQPVGLVVSIPALLEAQCYVNKNIMGQHARFLGCLASDNLGNVIPEITDLALFTQQVLDWQPEDLVEVPATGALPEQMSSLEVILPQYNETLRPTHIVPAFEPPEGQSPWLILIQQLSSDTDFDQPQESDSAKHWNAPPHAKFERLLRESGVPIGLLYNHRQVRLVYAPRGETSGYATFSVNEMAQVAGRPMFAALQMLLGADRLFSLAENQRLPHILENSRKYQNVVSTALAEQVTSALFELLRGFQAANDQRKGDLLRQVLANNPQHVYHGLLTVLMRLVFVLYAEDRGLVSSDPTYTNHYSVSGLFERLRSEAGRFPDTMDQRFGAWAQLLTLFRLIYEGGQHSEFRIPARKGYLFDPDRYPFLEGRFDDGNVDVVSDEEQSSAIQIPHISDGVVYRVLEDLLILDGERLSYRTLDVEQIGSVYEAIMGFELQVSKGRSIAIKPVKSHGAPATINLDSLLAAKPANRDKLLKEWTDQKLSTGDASALKSAGSIEELVASLDKKIAKHVTPGIVPADSMVFQPSDERRRSGSHYTPRSLTEPIVRTTLEPILKQLTTHPSQPTGASPGSHTSSPASTPNPSEPTGASPGFRPNPSDSQPESPNCTANPIAPPVTPKPIAKELRKRLTAGEIAARERLEQQRADDHTAAIRIGTPHPSQILDLKICDPAMGSGAFLVEACRQLGDELIKAWYAHDIVPPDIPPDEDEVLYARRLVAQRCLYGVDKNIMAVDLAKLSLWLVTLAKDHAFTFLDHSLRHGDSLVGLTRQQIIGFHWEPKMQKQFGEELIQKRLDKATEARAKILNAREDVTYRDQEQKLAIANEALNIVRLTGDACVSAFFAGAKKREREDRCEELFGDVTQHYQNLKDGKFDVTVRDRIAQAAASLRTGEHPIPPFHWEIEYPEVFSRKNGGFDVFVGNPPFLGGSRLSAISGPQFVDWLGEMHHGAHGKSDLVSYFFRQAFNLSRIFGTTGLIATKTIRQSETRSTGLGWICLNDGTIYNARTRVHWPGVAAVIVSVIHIIKGVPKSAVTQRVLDEKSVHQINSHLFEYGPDTNPSELNENQIFVHSGTNINGKGFVLTPEDRKRLVSLSPDSDSHIVPYLGQDEMVSSETGSHQRYVINFEGFSEIEVKKHKALYEHLYNTVRPQRQRSSESRLRNSWWLYSRPAKQLYTVTRGMERVLASGRHGLHLCFVFQPTKTVFSDSLTLFAFNRFAPFALLQSRIHEVWARCFGSSLGDTLRYIPATCFGAYPFPKYFLQYFCPSAVSDSRKFEVLEDLGETYYTHRSNVMSAHKQGLTDTYNRFHDPHEKSLEIAKLRELHAAMDRAVLEAYGWHDLAERSHCEFLLDYEEEEDDDSGSKKSTKKKPWRYRWPDDFRDEVLARLLELNQQRHEEELLAGSSPLSEKATKKKPTKPAKAEKESSPGLFEDEA